MDSSRALSELGLVTPTSADAIRRAYLRAVRAHPPERDPDGFRVVREAYDVLKDSPWLWAAESPEDEADHSEEDGAAPFDPSLTRTHEDDESKRLPEDEEEPEPDTGPADEFPESELSPAWKELYGAMETADFERAASILMASMRSGVGTDRVEVSPWQVLDCVLGLFTQGKYRLGGELLNCLDEWTLQQGIHPGHVGAPTAARWTLLKELYALHGKVEGYVLRGLVKAVEAGEFYAASAVLERAQSLDPSLQNRLSNLAPTIFAATYRNVTPAAKTKQFWHYFQWGSGWQFAWVGIVALQCLRMLGNTGSDDKTHDAPVTFRATETAAPDHGAGSKRWQTVHLIDRGIQAGACADVLEKWPLYLSELRAHGEDATDMKTYKTRRLSAIEMCTELEKELPEKP